MNDNSFERLKQLRDDIDEVDAEICELIAERAELAREIGKEKRALGLAIENKDREFEVIARCMDTCPGSAQSAQRVFSELIEDSKRIQRRELNLYLVGMPNCGKTKLAGRLELTINKRAVDMDALIMQDEDASIDYIFDHFGEKHFRIIENQMLVRLARQGGMIVATGGGILTYEPNIPILQASGIVVFLDRSPDGLVGAKAKNRPLIRDGAEAIVRLYKERINQYRTNADLCVDPDNADSVKRIAEFYISRTN